MNEWGSLSFKQIIISRQSNLKVIETNNQKIVTNILENRLVILNGKFLLEWLNLSQIWYKINTKGVFFLETEQINL
jgi:hypothetical protein